MRACRRVRIYVTQGMGRRWLKQAGNRREVEQVCARGAENAGHEEVWTGAGVQEQM